MRDSPPALGRGGGVNLDIDAGIQEDNLAATSASAAKRNVREGINAGENAPESQDTQQIDALRQQLLEDDSQLDDAHNAHSHSPRWPHGPKKTIQHINSTQRKENKLPEKDIPYSQLQAPASQLVSETQLQRLFEDTQFNNGFTKSLDGERITQRKNLHGHPSQSQDTQFFENLKAKLLTDETQLGDSTASGAAGKSVAQAGPSADLRVASEPGRSELVPGRETLIGGIPSQSEDTQDIEVLKAQLLETVVPQSQRDDNAKKQNTVLTDNSANARGPDDIESQQSHQVVLFPIGTSFGEAQQIPYEQGQFQSGSRQQISVDDRIYTIESSSGKQRVRPAPAQTHVHRRPEDIPTRPPVYPAQPNPATTTTNLAAPSKADDKHHLSAPISNQPQRNSLRNPSLAQINLLQARSMDDWTRDSLGSASQTQENDSVPRYGLTVKSQHGGSQTKQGRSSATQSAGSINMDVDRTYNENESGAVHLSLALSEISQNLAVSQDQGMRSPSYDLTKAMVDESQLEPETPAPLAKNPFGKSGAPMGMSQVFAATQSSPLDPRFLQSDGAMPSSPGLGLPSSPVARHGQAVSKTLGSGEASSPSHIVLTMESSFQPFDQSTQQEEPDKAQAQTTKPVKHIPDHIRAEVALKFAGIREPVDVTSVESEARKRQRQLTFNPPVEEESDDGMDDAQENYRRAMIKRERDKAERQIRQLSDLMAPRPVEERPKLDRVRSKASSDRVIKKNDVRAARLRKSEERTSPFRGNKFEEVEVPASGETRKDKASSKKVRKSRSQSEEYRAQSEGLDARDTQNSASQSVVIRSSQPRQSSQPEVVIDSQANISTQAETNHGSLEAIDDSYQPPESSVRPKSRLNRTSSAMLPALDNTGIGREGGTSSKQIPLGFNVPATSSGNYLRKGNETPGGSKSSSGETVPEVVPETSPPSKTASPEKPFEGIDAVVDSPMASFNDLRMTQDGPNESDITPSKIKRPSERTKIVTYGKRSPVKKRPEQVKGRGTRVVFTEEPSEPSDEDDEEVGTSNAGKRNAKKSVPLLTGKPASKSARFVPEEESDEDEAEQSLPPKKASLGGGKNAQPGIPANGKPAAKGVQPPLANYDGQNILNPPEELGRGKRKKVIPRKLVPNNILPHNEPSPESSPIRPAHRAVKRQPSGIRATPALSAVSISGGHDMAETSDDDAPIPRPTSKKRQIVISRSSDTEMADGSPLKQTNKLKSTSARSTTLLHIDDGDEDESVSPIRQSVEVAQKNCPRFAAGLSCKKNHSIDGLVHYPTKSSAQKHHGSSDIPSTASPGKSASPSASARRDSRSVSAFTRPDSADAPHLPPTATGGRTSRGANVPQAQKQSEYATARSSLPRSVASSPLSELAPDMVEELEDFHTANANTTHRDESSRSRSGTAMSDAALMPPPQTVTRTLDFAAPKPPAETPVLPNTSRRNKRSASEGGSKGKKAAKTTPEDTPSRSRRATRSLSAAASSADENEDEEIEDTIVVRDTPVRSTRQGRLPSRPSYAESPSDNESDDARHVLTALTRASRTPSPFIAIAVDSPQGEVRRDLFKGMAFAVSYRDSSPVGVRDREDIESLIVEHGGELIDDFKDLFEKTDTSAIATPAVSRSASSSNLASANTSFAGPSRRTSVPTRNSSPGDGDIHPTSELKLTAKAKKLGFVALIGDAFTRKSKFLQALALSLPCLNTQWIRYCIRVNKIVKWQALYMLSAGSSAKHMGMECSRTLPYYPATTARFEDTFRNRKKILEGMGVLFLITKKARAKKDKDLLDAKKEHYLWLTRALGAREVKRVKDVGEANRLLWDGGRADGNGWDVVYVDDAARLEEFKRLVLGARWYAENEDGEELEQVDDEDDDMDEAAPAPNKGKAKAKAKAKAKSSAQSANVAPPADADTEMPDADGEEASTQPAPPKRATKEEKKIRVVSDEFVVQSLILGCLEDEDVIEEE